MNGNLGEVFNTYNVNILFTVAALPAKVSMTNSMTAGMGFLIDQAEIFMVLRLIGLLPVQHVRDRHRSKSLLQWQPRYLYR